MARRSTNPLKLAHLIADQLVGEDLHGTFFVAWGKIEEYQFGHIYRALFDDTTIDLDGIVNLGETFRDWLEPWYDQRGQIRIRLTIEDDNGTMSDSEWRSLTRAVDPAYYEQLEGEVESWKRRSHYRGKAHVTGIELEIEPGVNYRRGRLYPLPG